MRYLLFLIVSVFLLQSCSFRNSDEVLTSDFLTTYTITDDGSSSSKRLSVTAKFKNRFESGDTIILSDGDIVQVLLDTNIFKLTERVGDPVGDNYYEKTFSGDNSDKEFKLSLIRNTENQMVSAPDSKVTLPQSFSISKPSKGQSFSHTAMVPLTWTALAKDKKYTPEMTILGSWTCDSGKTGDFQKIVTDDGAVDLDFNVLFYTDNCPATVTLEFRRKVKGSIDSRFVSGSKIEAIQTRTVTIKVIE